MTVMSPRPVRGASSEPISSCSSSSVSNPRSPPHASAMLAKISQSGRLIPCGAADRLQPLAPAFPRGDVTVLLDERGSGQERAGEGLQRAELQRLHHDPFDVLQRAMRERGIGQVPQRIDPHAEQHVDLAIGAGLQDRVAVTAGLAGSSTDPTRPPPRRPRRSVRPPGSSAGCTPARRAPRSFARRVTNANRAPTSRATASAGSAAPSRSPAITTPASPASRRAASAASRLGVDPARQHPGPRRPGAHSTCVATSCSRVRRGWSTQILAPRLAAFRRRRCRIGTSCSASSPTTRITAARSTSL